MSKRSRRSLRLGAGGHRSSNQTGGLVFTAPGGGPLRRTHFGRVWRKAAASVGLGGFRFHDLRHSSNTWAAATGASTRELMARMGHSSPRAALLYQHATQARDRTIADAMDAYVRGDLADDGAAVVTFPGG